MGILYYDRLEYALCHVLQSLRSVGESAEDGTPFLKRSSQFGRSVAKYLLFAEDCLNIE